MSKQHAVDFFVNAINEGDLIRILNLHQEEIWGYDLESVWDEMGRASKKRYENIINRTNEFQQTLGAFGGDLESQARQNENRISQITRDFQVQLETQSQQFNNQLSQLHTTVNGELKKQQKQINQVIRVQEEQRGEYLRITQELSTAIQRERNERTKDINNLQRQINNINAGIDNQVRTARELLKGVDVLICEIGKMPHQRFTPGKLNEIQTKLENNRRTLEAMPQGVWGNLTTIWQDLWDLRAEISVKEIEFNTKFDQALRASTSMLNEAVKNKQREMEFPGENEKKQVQKIDVDFWSNGELGKYEERIRSIKTRLERGENDMSFTIENLDATLDQIAKESPELANIIIAAGNNVAASQIRFDMAEIGANVLLDQLFDENSVKATYEGSDQRAGYVLQMENANGTKATIVVAPSEEITEQGKFKLTINFENDDEYISEEEIRERSQRIEQNILEEAKFCGAQKQGESSCSNSPDTRFSDFEAVKNRKTGELHTLKAK